MTAINVQNSSPVQAHCRHIFTLIQAKNLIVVICKLTLKITCATQSNLCLFHSPGCGRRFAVISNLRRHLRVHRPSHVRRRLTSQERREYVEKLIKRSGPSEIDESGSIDEGHMNYNSFPSMCYSSSSSTTSSTSSSPRQSMSPHMETTTYRLLKPKRTKPLCLTVQHLLN